MIKNRIGIVNETIVPYISMERIKRLFKYDRIIKRGDKMKTA